ncbi:MAG TPA: N-6 DNA methylase, partial [Anaerolineaceae bacterium]|nr:N-6 DNA methylase [Anaerolineaceae bacterium]
MANPPFAGDIKESRVIAKYELGKNSKGKYQSKVGRDILFIERNLNFLKPGGRMAIVLPQGRFNNSSDKYIRDFITEHCRILAVVGLHGNVFKPHTGTKTSVLFVQKWDDELCPKKEDYPIFFATMQEPSKDNSGDKIYVKNDEGLPVLDTHGHLVVQHDLFNHDGVTEDGIAEAFIEFAKKENLSFFLNSPFDKEKYEKLLNGLEISETTLNEVQKNKDCRVDSQFWTTKIHYNQHLEYRKIGEILTKSQYGISIAMNEEEIGYPIYRMNEIHDLLCDLEVDKYADITFKEAKKFILKDGDVLFNRTNSFEWVGRTGIYYKNELDNRDFVFASYLVRFNTDKKIILPEYLNVFLNCKYGVLDIKRRARQSINQTNVNPEEVKEMQIPILSMELQDRLRECLISASGKEKQSKNLYYSAENLLVAELGLENFNPSNEKISIKSLKESFLKTGRLDSEYYQPKYDDYLKKVFAYSEGYELVGECCNLKDKNYTPKDDTEYKYIELANVRSNAEIADCEIMIGKELPTRARRKVNTGDVIVSSIEGSLESCALISEEYNNSLCSTGFYVINSDKLNSESLLTVFKSSLMFNLMKKGCSGTILTNITKDEFLKLPVPLLRANIQDEIADYIGQSMEYSKKAKELLNISTKAVEIAIDTDEETAHNFLDR